MNEGQTWRANVEHANAQQDNPHPAVWWEVTTFGSPRRRYLCAECGWTFGGEPVDPWRVQAQQAQIEAIAATFLPGDRLAKRRRWWRRRRPVSS